MSVTTWPSEWLRGALGLCVLAVLREGPTYGYAISAALDEAGIGTVKGGTLYPLLARFESSGWVEVDWRAGEGGPGRKYYRLTAAGVAEQERQARQWAEFADVTCALVRDTVAARGERP